MNISVIIVNYNTCELTLQAIESVRSTCTELSVEIFVVDNNSSDGSQSILSSRYSAIENVHLLFNNENLGFSKANNQAIKKANGNFILLLNSDTIVSEHCLARCLKYCQMHPEIGALGCKVKLANGELDHACKRGFPTPSASLFYYLKLHKLFPEKQKFGRYTMSYLSENETGEVDALTGAFMFIPKKVFDDIGLLDEDFFMYGEDIDLCYRIKKTGYQIVYFPEATIIHLKRQSSKKRKNKTIYEFHRAMRLFYNKHYRQKYNLFVTLGIYIAITLRLLMSYFLNAFKR